MLAAATCRVHAQKTPSAGCRLVPIAVGTVGIDDRRMAQLAIRCQPIAPVSADDLQGWLELEMRELGAAVPRGTVRLSRLTQESQNADLETGWLVELETPDGEPPLWDDRLAVTLRDMRLLGLEPRLLVPAHPRRSEAPDRNGVARR
jgi:hypothetical protein